MKVLHLYSGNLFGGIERFLLTVAEYWQECPRMQPAFALCFSGQLEQKLQNLSVPVYSLGAVKVSRPWTVGRSRRRLSQLLRQEAFNVVICHACWSQALFGPVVLANQIPLVFFSHDALHGNHWLEWWAAQVRPQMAIANSHYTSSFLHSFYPGIPQRVLYPAVTLPKVQPMGRLRESIRAKLKTASETVVIILVARLERWKGHIELLNTLARLKPGLNWECWIVGGAQRPHETRYLQELHALVQQLGLVECVRFLGQQQEVWTLLATADIHCQPNTSPEPFGVAWVEALAAGLPVVTTAWGGAAEILDSTCGVLVPPGDAIALTHVLEQLIEDASWRAELSKAGPLRAKHLSDPGQQLQQLHHDLQQVSQ
jgi:glycosyltransferase involved in cell wall biosynthesis